MSYSQVSAYITTTSSLVDVIFTVAYYTSLSCGCHINSISLVCIYLFICIYLSQYSFVYTVIICGCHNHIHQRRHHLWMSYSRPAYLCLYNMEDRRVLYKSAMRSACHVTGETSSRASSGSSRGQGQQQRQQEQQSGRACGGWQACTAGECVVWIWNVHRMYIFVVGRE